MSNMATDPRYPIGKYQPESFSPALLQEWLNDIRSFPGLFENAILNLDEEQLNTPYREGGWKIKQLVHHVADSHMNAYIRFKLGLTEDGAKIKPYQEKLWAQLNDNDLVPCNVSLTLLHALHLRWHAVIRDLTPKDWERTVHHPEHQRDISLWFLLGMYSWHGRHHLAHIMRARELYGWS